jgi:hypothetical protein
MYVKATAAEREFDYRTSQKSQCEIGVIAGFNSKKPYIDGNIALEVSNMLKYPV